MSVLSRPYFHDEQAAFDFVEAIIWPTGPVCPHCGCTGRISTITPNAAKRVRFGLKRCGDCKGQFTVRMGTIFEESKLPMTKWLQAIFLMTASKKGVSSHQLHRTLEVTYKTAWFLSHRIREAMRSGELAPFGEGGGMVEADGTFIGVEPGEPITRGANHKMKVLSLVDRTTGEKRSFVLDFVSAKAIGEIVSANLSREAILMTDEARHYVKIGEQFAGQGHTNHAAGEYVSRFNPLVHTNTVEGSFSIVKRGTRGVCQHCYKKHLHRYLAEFDFRYSYRVALGVDDSQRAIRALQGVVGKRLTYRRPDGGGASPA
ncbi:IS1595 family transposase [uncultured Phenylobacterium sp.]|uniref:IS1595 family transposase n=1 Tax=uncultured Phenylobacterium sp. TaxID=349273 RepID=UPI0025E8E7FD|nr:IS1595 family transposase [uncultured Phenylobacterium sp.]